MTDDQTATVLREFEVVERVGDKTFKRLDRYALAAALAEAREERLKWESSCAVAWGAMELMQADIDKLLAALDHARTGDK